MAAGPCKVLRVGASPRLPVHRRAPPLGPLPQIQRRRTYTFAELEQRKRLRNDYKEREQRLQPPAAGSA